MKKIKFSIGIGYFGCTQERVYEYPDNVTEEQLEDDFKDWVYDHLDAWYEEVNEETEG